MKILIVLFCLICFFNTSVFADVGSFEDYGGGDSWGGSFEDYSSGGSSWGGSSYDSYDSYGGGGGTFLFFGGFGDLIIYLIIIAIVYYVRRNSRNRGPRNYRPQNINYQTISMEVLEKNQTEIENTIQASDPNFNGEELVAWSKNLFIKLQNAWTERNWQTIRSFETESLFEQHKNQLQGYINNKQINVMDRICVNYAHLYKYKVEGDKEILTVRLNSRMTDYIINEETKAVIKGDKNLERVNTYLLTFIRKNGVKTKAGTIEINTTNCPNCGAPTQITSSGKCEYCGSVLTTGEYNWVLSNLERERM